MVAFFHAADLHLGVRLTRFEPAIAKLLAKSDYDSLHYCLIDLQRQIGDSISGYGY